MCSNNRMLACDRLTTANTTTSQAAGGLLVSGVDGFQTVQTLPEFRRKTLVSQSHVTEQSVTTASGSVEEVEEGGAWGLVLESDIRVPGDGVGMTLQKVQATSVISTPMNQMDFGVALGSTRGLVNVVPTEVSTILNCLFDGNGSEILVTED
jgi:hypothetical protein